MTHSGILLLLLVSAALAKCIYVGLNMPWGKAQEYCRSCCTDLASICNGNDSNLLFDDPEVPQHGCFWIGLIQDPGNATRWLWSGGGEATKMFWARGEPNDFQGREEDRGCILVDRTWNDAPHDLALTFFCYRVHTVRERKTWEEALDHCRRHHSDLVSVASETDMMLMQKEVGKFTEEITEHVWIGLRFLAEEWLWVDRQPLEYEAWGPEGKPKCPALQRCAALQVTGTSHLIKGISGEASIPDVKVWNARTCDDKLYFVCY